MDQSPIVSLAAGHPLIDLDLTVIVQFVLFLILFVVANRLSTLRRAHEILVLEDGRVVERGTHEELMELHGVYFRAASLQAADNESQRLLAKLGAYA